MLAYYLHLGERLLNDSTATATFTFYVFGPKAAKTSSINL